MSENAPRIESARGYTATYATYSVMSVPERNRNNGETEPTINDMVCQMCRKTEMDGWSVAAVQHILCEADCALPCSSISLILFFSRTVYAVHRTSYDGFGHVECVLLGILFVQIESEQLVAAVSYRKIQNHYFTSFIRRRDPHPPSGRIYSIRSPTQNDTRVVHPQTRSSTLHACIICIYNTSCVYYNILFFFLSYVALIHLLFLFHTT